ncbi:hypothetical protein [Pseudokineococcus lusitanus]|uniref:Uncharacterized protein n=1 Tax=Pseudokineococcus lusitanus TaxID=763993 RepID=A0A3N1HJU1_9ACTN|nr:hypothetical protein [Pseudokineococcus lusitanus]ROP42776.1 hypothetical protein EDC03_2061 [Pseudokineococcus lusitanus]
MAGTTSRRFARRFKDAVARHPAPDLRRGPSGRVVAVLVGAVLVLGNGLLVLGPVLGLVGAAAAAGPVLDVPAASGTVVVVLGYLVAVALLAGAWASRRTWSAWTLAVLAWLVSLAVSLWPLVATANAAVDRVGDIWPWITELVRSVS